MQVLLRPSVGFRCDALRKTFSNIIRRPPVFVQFAAGAAVTNPRILGSGGRATPPAVFVFLLITGSAVISSPVRLLRPEPPTETASRRHTLQHSYKSPDLKLDD